MTEPILKRFDVDRCGCLPAAGDRGGCRAARVGRRMRHHGGSSDPRPSRVARQRREPSIWVTQSCRCLRSWPGRCDRRSVSGQLDPSCAAPESASPFLRHVPPVLRFRISGDEVLGPPVSEGRRWWSWFTRIIRGVPGGRAGWQRHLAGMDVVSSAANSSPPNGRPSHWWASRSSTRGVWLAKCGSVTRIHDWYCPGLRASCGSHRRTVGAEAFSSRSHRDGLAR